MLTVARNQLRVCLLSLKYNMMREMVNKVTFLTNVSAIGDFLYGIMLALICGSGVGSFCLFLVFTVTGAAVFTSFALLLGSLSFWFVRMDLFSGQLVMCIGSFGTYPDGIFKGFSRFILYFIIPVGMAVWHPVHVMVNFDAVKLFLVTGYAVLLSVAAAAVFYRGLRRYASGNLMEARL